MREMFARIRGLFGRQQQESDLSEELRAHLDLLAAEFVRRGMSPDEARFAARREFGAMEKMREAYRDRRGLPILETLFHDIHFGARMLRKSPASPPSPSSLWLLASAPIPQSLASPTPHLAALSP